MKICQLRLESMPFARFVNLMEVGRVTKMSLDRGDRSLQKLVINFKIKRY